MKNSITLLIYFTIAAGSAYAQPRTDQFLKNIISGSNDSIVQKVTSHPEQYRFQIIYTQITRDNTNHLLPSRMKCFQLVCCSRRL